MLFHTKCTQTNSVTVLEMLLCRLGEQAYLKGTHFLNDYNILVKGCRAIGFSLQKSVTIPSINSPTSSLKLVRMFSVLMLVGCSRIPCGQKPDYQPKIIFGWFVLLRSCCLSCCTYRVQYFASLNKPSSPIMSIHLITLLALLCPYFCLSSCTLNSGEAEVDVVFHLRPFQYYFWWHYQYFPISA